MANAQTCGPVLTSIVIDANLSDLTAVLTDADNAATDPEGTQFPSTDRDYPVPSRSRDLVGFASTWNSTTLYLYWRRNNTSNNTTYVFFYAGRNDNGRMESTDRVVVVRSSTTRRLHRGRERRGVAARPAPWSGAYRWRPAPGATLPVSIRGIDTRLHLPATARYVYCYCRPPITVRDSMCPASSSGVHQVGFICRKLKSFSVWSA